MSTGLFSGGPGNASAQVEGVVIDEPTVQHDTLVDSAYGWNRTDVPLTYPSSLDFGRQTVHIACMGLGYPMNALVACVMFRQRRLRNPRNTFWLGTIICNVLALTNAAVEYVAFETQHPVACFLFSSTAGMPYTVNLEIDVVRKKETTQEMTAITVFYDSLAGQLLLVNLLLATADRWLALTYPLFHRESVTVGLVIGVQLVILSGVLVCWTLPFSLGTVQLPRCAVNPIFLEWISVSYALLTLFTIAAQVTIYLKARNCLRRTRSGLTASHVHHRISRLELEATVTLVVGVASLCLFSLPFSMSTVANAVCRRYATPAQLGWCDSLRAAMPYCRELFIVHAVYSPVMFMIRSREFSRALRSIIADNCSVRSE